MTPQEVIQELESEGAETLEAFRRELGRVRTGRASTALLETLQAEYYGAKTPILQMATLSAPEPRLLVVQPFDKAALQAIEKAIMQSDLRLTPQTDGKVIRIPIPELTEERRKEIVRQIRKIAEEFRISVRSHRRDALDLLESLVEEKEITQDEERRHKDSVEAATKGLLEKLDAQLAKKEEDVMTV